SMIPKLLAPETLNARPRIVGQVREMIGGTAVETAVTALVALRDRADSTGLLDGVDVPTLVIAGAEDAIIPVEVQRTFAGKIPQAEFQVIEGAGHVPPMEQTEAFNGRLAGFLKSIA